MEKTRRSGNVRHQERDLASRNTLDRCPSGDTFTLQHHCVRMTGGGGRFKIGTAIFFKSSIEQQHTNQKKSSHIWSLIRNTIKNSKSRRERWRDEAMERLRPRRPAPSLGPFLQSDVGVG